MGSRGSFLESGGFSVPANGTPLITLMELRF